MNHFKPPKLILLMMFIASVIIFIECQEDQTNTFQSEGEITGADTRECVCCGGWFIDIDSTTYNFWLLPGNANFSLENATFPIHVNLDWQPDTSACGEIGKLIEITRIERAG